MSKQKGQTITLAPKSSPAAEVSRTLKALDLKRRGHSYDEIAERLQVDAWTAREIISLAYSRIATELADEIRIQVEDRLDDLLRRLHNDLMGAESQTARNGIYTLILRVESQRANLLGLNIPSGVPDATPPAAD